MNDHENHAAGLNGVVVRQVKAERSARDWTIKRLADESGIPERTLSRYITFQRPLQLGHVEALARAFGLTSEGLIARAQSERGGG